MILGFMGSRYQDNPLPRLWLRLRSRAPRRNRARSKPVAFLAASFLQQDQRVVGKGLLQAREEEGGVSTERNFALSAYRDGSGRAVPMHWMNEDCFLELVMPFTGEEARC